MPDSNALRRRIQLLIWLFIVGLVVSGATAIPLVTELNWVARWFPVPEAADNSAGATLARWIHRVRDGVTSGYTEHPFLAYGTDWLAFGHFAIAIAFIGPLRDPVRNIWVLTFGLIACALVVPYALIFGELRSIPVWWRLIDCAFGLIGFPLLWHARQLTLQLEAATQEIRSTPSG